MLSATFFGYIVSIQMTPFRSPYVIDDAIATTLASTRSSPAQLADTS